MKEPIGLKLRLVKVSNVGTYPYTHWGVQRMIRDILDRYGISRFELAKRAQLTPAAIYQIMKKTAKQVSKPPRKSTIQALARAIDARVTFDSRSNMVLLHHEDLPQTRGDVITEFLLQIADAIKQSGRTDIPRDERDRILRVIRVLL